MPTLTPDSQSLGQLMVMQNCIPLMENDQQVFALVNRGLCQVPGVAASEVRLHRGAPPRSGSEGRVVLPVETLHEHFGWLDLALSDVDAFALYEPFVRNLAGVIALWLTSHARQRRLEETLNRLEQALHEREAFLAMVSHDLANPLGAIVNVAQTLKGAGCPADRVIAGANLIERSARRMSRMIHDLLDLEHIDAGGFSVVRAPQDLLSLIGDAIEECRCTAARKDIELIVPLAGDLSPVPCDGHRIAQVLCNLIGNAIKFTPPGGKVAIALIRQRGEVKVSVSDTGPGIDHDDLPHVFDRFYRAKDVREAGTGLGLAIARAIVDLHGGHIDADSEPGHGACFSFTLPLAAEIEAAQPVTAT